MNVVQEKYGQFNKTKKAMIARPVFGGKSLMGPPLATPIRKSVTNSVSTSSTARLKNGGQLSTPHSRTTSSGAANSNNSHIVMAISEGRGKSQGTVGLAAIDIDRPKLILCEISDNHTYTKTMSKINVLQPIEILVPTRFVENTYQSRLLMVLKEQFPNQMILTVPRGEYNRLYGMAYVERLCAPLFNSIVLFVRSKYFTLSAVSALMRYVESVKHKLYASHSIKIEYQEPENTTMIDMDTANRLQLDVSYNQGPSLMSILDQNCVTSVGKKMLRSTLLQPPYQQNVIEARLDCVDELLTTPELLVRIRTALENVNNIEQSLRFGTAMPQSAENVSQLQLNYTLQLKAHLNGIAPLVTELEATRHVLFKSIYQVISEYPYKDILKNISDIVNEDTHPAKGYAGDMQRCFAIKSGINDFLDVARRAYTELIDDIRTYVEGLSTEHNLPLHLRYTQQKGFHILLILSRSTRNMKTDNLPPEFIQVVANSNNFSMTTIKLINFGARLRESSQEIQSLSNIIIYQLLLDIKPYIGHLYELCDNVALLDIICASAQMSSAPGYVKPRFSNLMEVIDGRHPLLEHVSTVSEDLIPNPITASERNNLHIITGPNMSGKSIYIKQIGLLQVMAQIGCFLPAASAAIRLSRHIYVRMGAEKNVECNVSSFALEMTEIQHVLHTLTDTSLIILDELCCSTNWNEGLALAFAICEYLLATKAFTFITTHMHNLTKLAELYANATNWNLETLLEENRMTFTHRLLPGFTTINNYGVKLIRLINTTKSISERAEELAEELDPQLRLTMVTSRKADASALYQYKKVVDSEIATLKRQLSRRETINTPYNNHASMSSVRMFSSTPKRNDFGENVQPEHFQTSNFIDLNNTKRKCVTPPTSNRPSKVSTSSSIPMFPFNEPASNEMRNSSTKSGLDGASSSSIHMFPIDQETPIPKTWDDSFEIDPVIEQAPSPKLIPPKIVMNESIWSYNNSTQAAKPVNLVSSAYLSDSSDSGEEDDNQFLNKMINDVQECTSTPLSAAQLEI